MTRVKRLKSKSQSHPSGPAFFFFFFLKNILKINTYNTLAAQSLYSSWWHYQQSHQICWNMLAVFLKKKRCKLSVNNSNSVIVIAAFLPSLANIKFLFSVQFLYLKDCFLGLIIKWMLFGQNLIIKSWF